MLTRTGGGGEFNKQATWDWGQCGMFLPASGTSACCRLGTRGTLQCAYICDFPMRASSDHQNICRTTALLALEAIPSLSTSFHPLSNPNHPCNGKPERNGRAEYGLGEYGWSLTIVTTRGFWLAIDPRSGKALCNQDKFPSSAKIMILGLHCHSKKKQKKTKKKQKLRIAARSGLR